MSGRVDDIAFSNGAPLVAADAGGLWLRVSPDPPAPAFWAPLTDRQLPSQDISTVAVNPTNPNFIVIGTPDLGRCGENPFWWSDDLGSTWHPAVFDPFHTPGSVYRIRFSSSSIAHAAASNGYHRSTDGGKTWARTSVPDLESGVTDVAVTDADPQLVYLGVYGKGLYRSPDGGATWSPVSNPNLPGVPIGRVGVSICGTDRETVYAMFGAPDGGLLGIYRRSFVRGVENFIDVTPRTSSHAFEQTFVNGLMNLQDYVAACPNNPFVVAVGSWYPLFSQNGGQTWYSQTDGPPNSFFPKPPGNLNQHQDVRAITWQNGNSLWLGHDGGISNAPQIGTWDPSSGIAPVWSTAINDLPITEFFTVDSDRSDMTALGGGTQDNGDVYTLDGGNHWEPGDEFDSYGFAVDPDFLGTMWRCDVNNTGGGDVQLYNPGGGWVTTLSVPQVPTGLSTDEAFPTSVYMNACANLYYYSTADYPPPGLPQWRTFNTSPFSSCIQSYSTLGAGPNLQVYVCLQSTQSDRLEVYDGSDPSPQFRDLEAGLPTGKQVLAVAPSKADRNVAYAVLGDPNIGWEAQIYVTFDRGAHWFPRTGNFPSQEIPTAIVTSPIDRDVVVVGTTCGCYITQNGMQSSAQWRPWNDGLPLGERIYAMKTVDLRASGGSMTVLGGTYGRGIWQRDLPAADTTASVADAGVGAHLWQSSPNPARVMTQIAFDMAEAADVSLTLFDLSGREIRSLERERLSAGHHVVPVNVAMLRPGLYVYELQTGARRETRRLVVVR